MARRSRPDGPDLKIEYIATTAVTPDPLNARKHSQRQLARLKAMIAEVGFSNPILVDEQLVVIAGHARLEAAKALGMQKVPCVRLSHLTKPQKTALAIADNKIGDMSHFDPELLAKQLADLCAIDFPVELTGFETAEVDILLDTSSIGSRDPADNFVESEPDATPVSREGDLWVLGDHRLHCANGQVEETYGTLLGDRRAEMVFTDAPFNLRLYGGASNLGQTMHRKAAGASDETSEQRSGRSMSTIMALLTRVTTNGSIHFHFVDWRYLRETLEAGAAVYSELKALCVWNKNSGGTGSLYRSKHELVLVYKHGTAPHINNIELGRYGRDRSNVWDYADASNFPADRGDDLTARATVKPVSLVADAIRDCSRRGGLVLDPFAGSGTTILAAERTGRRAAAIELEPRYVDTAILRWQALTGGKAVLAEDGSCFEDIASARSIEEAGHG